jgi:hypothetical protein
MNMSSGPNASLKSTVQDLSIIRSILNNVGGSQYFGPISVNLNLKIVVFGEGSGTGHLAILGELIYWVCKRSAKAVFRTGVR